MDIKKDKTQRGFALYNFEDHYGVKCSLQKSSLADEDAIWFGVDDADPKIMAKNTPQGGNGWVKFDIPENVILKTRMHLTTSQVKQLLPILKRFAKTGKIN